MSGSLVRVLVVSTVHLHPDVAGRIEKAGGRYECYETRVLFGGWAVGTRLLGEFGGFRDPEDPGDAALALAVAYARGLGCDRIEFDQDAYPEAVLEEFGLNFLDEWEKLHVDAKGMPRNA